MQHGTKHFNKLSSEQNIAWNGEPTKQKGTKKLNNLESQKFQKKSIQSTIQVLEMISNYIFGTYWLSS